MHSKNTNKVKTDPQPVRVAVLGLTADSYVRLQLSDSQSSVIQRLLVQLPLRLGGGSPELLLIKRQRRKYSLRICKMACCCTQHSWAFVIQKALEDAVLCQRRKRRTAFAAACFSRRSACLFTTSRSSLHISHSYGSWARLFSMFTRPCQASSQFMVSHSCVSSLCFFLSLRNLLSILKPSTHNLF